MAHPWPTEATPPLPGRHDIEAAVQVIHDNADRLFLWDYERDRGQLVTLYNKAMGSQWNSVTDLDWSIDVDPERLVAEQDSPLLAVARVAGTLPGSPHGGVDARRSTSQLGIEFFKANLSQFMHGEQGAMMTAAKIVETVPWIDAKYYASTQTMDEARHTEVFAKYLRTKLGDAYPMSPFLKAQIWSLLEDSALGHRVPGDADRHRVAGAGRVRRHAAADEGAAADEAAALRHVRRGAPRGLRRADAVGVLPRPERGRAEGAPGVPRRRHPELAGPGHHARGVGAHGHDGRGRAALHHARRRRRRRSTRRGGFARGFFAKLVPNVRKLGLLDANNGYLREKWGEAGLLEFEFADDTGSDYESYDEVAQDRAARRRRRPAPSRRGEPRRRGRATLARVRTLCLALPEAVERPFGDHTSPAFRVRDKFFAMTSEDGTSMTSRRPGRAGGPGGIGPGSASSCPSTWGTRAGSASAWTCAASARLGRAGRDDRRELLPHRAQAPGRPVVGPAGAGSRAASAGGRAAR